MHFRLKLLLFLLAFSAPVLAQHAETKILRGVTNGQATQWETVEIGLRIPVQERLYRQFLEDHSKGLNPYAMQNLRLQFTCNGKTYVVPAFYMQDASPDENVGKFVAHEAEWPWRVRFAVPDTGSWECLVLVGNPVQMAVPQNAGIRFTCVKGTQHGFLRVGEDQQHLEFSDGKPFFALGQNIAWCDPQLHGHPGPYPVYSSGYYELFHYIHNLADNGGNMVRIVMAPWFTGFEWEQAGVYEQDRAWVMDSILRICEARGLYLYLCVEMHTGYTVHYDRPYCWDAHPYKKALGLNAPTEALTNDSAIALFKQKMRYLLARWGTSSHLAVVELLSEMNGWDNYSEHEEDFVRWHETICRYIRTDLPHTHALLTSCFGQPPFGHLYDLPELNLISSHRYANNFHAAEVRYKVVNGRNIATEQRGMRTRWNKPFIFGEMGMTNGPVNAADADDWEHCSDWSYHNALWSTAFMGGYGAGLNWWQWNNDAYRAANFPVLRWFVDSIAGDMSFYSEPGMWEGNGLEVVYAAEKYNYRGAVGWVHNTSYWWGNNPDSCLDRSGKNMIRPRDDDKASTPVDRSGRHFEVSGLNRFAKYLVYFYDTRKKNTPVQYNDRQAILVRANAFGTIRVPMPASPDLAFKIQPLIPFDF